MRSGHYPHIAAIDSYGSGGFRFADMSHRGSLLCLPSGMHAWDVKNPGQITEKALGPVLDQADRIDVLLIGMGKDPAFLSSDLHDILRQSQIIVEATTTAGAISTYNILLNEDRAVAAALIAVQRPPGPSGPISRARRDRQR